MGRARNWALPWMPGRASGLDGPWNFTMYSRQKAQIFRPFPKSWAPGLLGLGPFSKSRAPGLPKNTGLGPGPGRTQARTHHYTQGQNHTCKCAIEEWWKTFDSNSMCTRNLACSHQLIQLAIRPPCIWLPIHSSMHTYLYDCMDGGVYEHSTYLLGGTKMSQMVKHMRNVST